VNNEEAKALGLRALECEGFRWMPGMALVYGVRSTIEDRVLEHVWNDLHDESIPLGIRGKEDEGCQIPAKAWPDFRDPATLGCLLALVREAWESPRLRAAWVEVGATKRGKYQSRWVMFHRETWGDAVIAGGDTEAEALVAALEAAP
jgi:hypothetical protein